LLLRSAGHGKEYERAQDYSYQELARLAKRSDLPADTAARVYEVKEAAEASVKQIQSNQDLSPEKRQEALRQIQAETENTVKTTLGMTISRSISGREAGGLTTWPRRRAPQRLSPSFERLLKRGGTFYRQKGCDLSLRSVPVFRMSLRF
jgi:hypothetical protein